jgi:hypothetical protein
LVDFANAEKIFRHVDEQIKYYVSQVDGALWLTLSHFEFIKSLEVVLKEFGPIFLRAQIPSLYEPYVYRRIGESTDRVRAQIESMRPSDAITGRDTKIEVSKTNDQPPVDSGLVSRKRVLSLQNREGAGPEIPEGFILRREVAALLGTNPDILSDQDLYKKLRQYVASAQMIEPRYHLIYKTGLM